jgi:hypothetical protein
MGRARLAIVVIALACAGVAIFFVVAAVTGPDDGPDYRSGLVAVTTGIGGSNITPGGDRRSPGDGDGDGNPHHDTVPCTGPKEPVNFEVFSAGPAPAGLPLTGTLRRCDVGVPAWGWPNNYVNYTYGTCEIPRNATGCSPPLAIQTWPACQRSLVDYTFEGKPLSYRKMPKYGGAEVVEFDFDGRIEVYTRSVTVVIFANDSALARQAVGMLKPQDKGKPPATNADALRGTLSEGLAPPSNGSMEGDLPCKS